MSKKKVRMSFYEYHGLVIHSQGPKDTYYDCPFCDSEGKFSANNETGQYRCLKPSCGKKGNRISFMQDMIESAEESSYDELLDLKPALTEGALSRVGVFLHPLRNLWCLPTYKGKNKLANLLLLFQFKKEGKQVAQWRGSPDCGVQLLGCERIKRKVAEVHLFEGVWDYIAALSYFSMFRDTGENLVKVPKYSHSMAMAMNICGVPGADTYNEKFSQLVGGRDIFTYFDNDDAGRIGTSKIANYHTVMGINWQEIGNFKPGYDFSDFINDEGKSAWYKLQKSMKLIDASDPDVPSIKHLIEPLPCENYDAVRSAFSKALHFTRQIDDALATSLAVCASTPIPGTQIWLRIIGPAGSGKTVIAESLALAREWVISRSEVTGFHSGVNTTGKSMIEKMNGKTFIVKEADTLMSSKSRDTVLPQLRDIFDGSSRVEYRNGVISEHENMRTTFILCGTDLVRRLNKAHLGDRFLDIEVYAREQDPTKYVDTAMSNMLQHLNNGKPDKDHIDKDKLQYASQLAAGYLEWMRTDESFRDFKPVIPEETLSKLRSLAYLLAFLRARDIDDDEIMSRAEVPTRLSQQFTRLCFCLAKVLGTEVVTPRTRAYKITKQVMLDTGRSYLLEVFKLLAKGKPMTVKELASKLVFVQTYRINTSLKNMQHFGVTEYTTTENGKPGRAPSRWRLSYNMQQHWNNI